MNKDTDNQRILNFWSEKSNATNAVYAYALKILSANPQAGFNDLSKDAAFQRLARQNNMTLLGGPMLGNIGENSASIWVRTLKPSSVMMEVTGQDYHRKWGPVRSSADTDLSAVLAIEGLQPATTYTYRLFIDGNPVSGEVDTRFRTTQE